MTEQEDKVISSFELQEKIKDEPEVHHFSYGHGIMDDALDGLALGDFICLGGLAKHGKSQFAVSLTRKFVNQGLKCLWFSVELTYREFLSRFGSDIPLFYVPKKRELALMKWLEDVIDEGIKKYGINIVFIDHIGIISNEALYRNGNGTEIIDERLKEIKRWAVDKEIVIVGIFPSPQEAAKKSPKAHPTLSDFRGSSMIGHTVDTALWIKRKISKREGVAINDILDDEDFGNNEAELHIVACRRKGKYMGCYINMELDENGNFSAIGE